MIEVPHPEMTGFVLYHYLSLALIGLSLMLVAAVILCWEIRGTKHKRLSRVSPDQQRVVTLKGNSPGIITTISDAHNDRAQETVVPIQPLVRAQSI